MSRRSLLCLLVAAVVAAPGVVAAQPPSPAEVRYRIMPLGDSITAGPGCWRALLWDRLQQAGHVNVDFAGSRSGGGCSVPHDGTTRGTAATPPPTSPPRACCRRGSTPPNPASS